MHLCLFFSSFLNPLPMSLFLLCGHALPLMLPFSPNARIPQLQQHPLMALQVHRILLPSLERCWVIRNSSLCLGKGTTFMNIGVHLRVSGRCFGFLGSARGWRSNPAEELIGAKLFSSRSGKSLLCKAETKEVGDSVELPNGKANSWVELVDDAKKHEEVVVGAGSLKEKMKVISKTSRSKKAVKTSKVASVKGKPESKKGNAVESGKKAAEGGTKKKTTAKNNRETTVAKAPAERNQKAVSKKEEAKKLEKSVALAAAEDEGLKRSSSRAKEANDNGALDVAKTNSQILQVGSWISGREKLRPLYPPSGRSVVVVESVTKAKVIQNYLGDMYEVLPSYGHVRDLAGKSRSVRPDDDFSMVWEVPSSALTHLKSIKVALSGAENLILASDPDREGEAIAWHITEMLYQQGTLNEMTTVARVVFHEITESSIKSALQVPRALDLNLINAYLARRALDYLIGFSISPLLWRKLPGCQSAGRVQSAALGLICDREMEIEQFEAQEYWTVGVEFHTMHSPFLKSGASIRSSLISLDSIKLDQLSISSSLDAEAVKKRILSSDFDVISVKPSKVNRSPPTPYITSTLQQDSSNKLRFSTNYTMQLAQKLYEGIKLSEEEATGLITYMRTDGLNISTEAATDIHSFIKERYGEEFASKSLRRYFKKVKNAQEAHEAIRPTNIRRLPSSLVGILDDDSLKLYTLIWTRTVACQMESSSTDMVQVDIRNTEGDIAFRSTGSKVGFPGYQAVYKDREMDVSGSDEIKEDITEAASDVLHMLKVKDRLKLGDVELKQHYTKPPPRYSEGALVKKLEELGIGRPSTYASIIKVLQDRNYVTLKSRVLYPEFRGRMVSAFLSHYFSEVADYRFTADMENELDNVSAGRTEWKGLLKDFWSRFSNYCDLAMHTNVRQVESMLGEKYGQILFSSLPIKSRVCPSCSQGTLIFKVSRFGAGYFIGCDQHPKCKYIAGNVLDDEDDRPGPDKQRKSFMPKLLGHCPDSNEKIFLKKGPYGYYVQLGDDRHGYTPKRASVTESVNPEMLTLEAGLELLLSKKTKKFSRPKKLRNPKEVLLE